MASFAVLCSHNFRLSFHFRNISVEFFPIYCSQGGFFVNHHERKHLKRTSESRDQWKSRALESAADRRAMMFRNRDLVRSREEWRNKAMAHAEASTKKDEMIKQLKSKVTELEECIEFFEEQSKALLPLKKSHQTSIYR